MLNVIITYISQCDISSSYLQLNTSSIGYLWKVRFRNVFLPDAAQQVLENPTQTTDTSSDFANSISQAIQSLNAGAEGLQAPINEEELMKMFTAGEGSGQENNLLPFMQGKKNDQNVLFLVYFEFLLKIQSIFHVFRGWEHGDQF